MEIRSHRDLDVWKVAMDLVEEVYRLAKALPNAERFGLISQMQRAAVSVPANIAEGHGRGHTAEYVQHLLIARGSLMELSTHLAIAQRLNYLQEVDLPHSTELVERAGKMLNGLIKALKAKS